MALQPYADGSYNIVYDIKNTVELRDWMAKMANTLTDHAVAYLDAKKKDEKRKSDDRAKRARELAFPASKTGVLEQEQRRVDVSLPMMGDDDVPAAEVLDKPRTIPPVKKPALVPVQPPRIINTAKGPVEVAADVSDDDLAELGIEAIIAKIEETQEPSSSNDERNTSDDEVSS